MSEELKRLNDILSGPGAKSEYFADNLAIMAALALILRRQECPHSNAMNNVFCVMCGMYTPHG